MKRRKIKKKNLYILIFIISIILLFIFTKNKLLNNTKYSKESIKILNNNKIKIKDYSETLDKILNTKYYKIEFLEEYAKIDYIETNDFFDKINKYLEIGYKGNEINDIFKLSLKNQDKLLNLNKLDFQKYLNIKNFDVLNIDRYNKYLETNDIDIKTAVTYVNINLDYEYYTNTKEVDDPNSLYVLVNKYNHLPKNYKPSDLIYVNGAYGNEVPIRGILKDDFIKLQNAAKEEIKINLMPTTAFRGESFQKTLYDNYVASDGVKNADTYSARPGYSEHQTGLAIDLKNTALNNTRLTDDNYNWLSNNAYKYGFIIRFPKDKESITGYQFENWHIRYVGEKAAKIIHDNNLTLEEYCDLYIIEY